MSEPCPPLPKTLARIEELCALLGRPLEEVLDVRRLSRAAGLTTLDVRTLLAGGTPAEEDPDHMVRQRVRCLYETYTDDTDQPRDLHEIAAAIKQTPTWTKRLVEGKAKPNILVGHALCRLYGVDKGFLTDPPAEALDRELRLLRLELEMEADPEEALRTLGVVHIAGRSPHDFQRNQLAALARMVAAMSEQLDGVRDRLRGMGFTEEER